MFGVILIITVVGYSANGVPVTDSCGAQFREALNKTMRLKETCRSAEFADCCEVVRFSKLFSNESLKSSVYNFVVTTETEQPFMIREAPKISTACNMDSNGGGWTVLVRRTLNGSVSFQRGWVEYENGFGDLDSEFWYGLKKMHAITNREPMDLEIELRKNIGDSRVLQYGAFRIDGPDTKYILHVSDPKQGGHDSFAHHNGRVFSTSDNGSSCVGSYGNGGGWWFGQCYDLTLTRSGPKATQYDGTDYLDFDFAELRVRPKSCTQKTQQNLTCNSD